MKNYTLNQFYYEAQVLVEKYQKKGCFLRCQFEITNEGKGPALEFTIVLSQARLGNNVAYGFGSNPANALSAFERELMTLSGRTLSANDYSVELADEDGNPDSPA